MATQAQFGHFTLKERIGVGGFGEVFIAQNRTTKRNVAVKILAGPLSPAALRELQMARTLRHPAIVRVLDSGFVGQSPYLEMEFMEHGSLAGKMERHPNGLSINEAYAILQRVAAALDYAHNKHVIHRDIKPANILFDANNRAYLADFGIAREMAQTLTMTEAGTQGYMSPEQILAHQQDAYTDIYALGVVLFEMLTGRHPFSGTTYEILHQHVTAALPLASQYNVRVPPACDLVIQKATAKERQQRYKSAAVMASEFEQAAGLKRAGQAKRSQVPLVAGLALLFAALVWFVQSGPALGPLILAAAGVVCLLPWLPGLAKFTGKFLWAVIKLLFYLFMLGVGLFLLYQLIQMFASQ